MSRKFVIAVLGALMVSGLAGSALASAGAGAISLSLPIGARYNALGEAGTALSQDATALWWNTGGLGFLARRYPGGDLQMMTSSLAAGLANDIRLTWLGYGRPLGNIGAIATSINYLDMGWQKAVDEDNNEGDDFHSYMFSVSAGYGVKIMPTLGVGVGIKYFRDSLAPDAVMQDSAGGGGSGSSFGVDFGAQLLIPQLKSRVGLSIANLGPDITHVDAAQSDPMPRKATLGIASGRRSEYGGVLMVADLLVPLYKYVKEDDVDGYVFGLDYDQNEWGVGFEFDYNYSLFLRLGWKNVSGGDIHDLTYGMGLDLNEWIGRAFIFDFAWVPQAEGLPHVTRITAGYRF
ncbi:MAG: PorV/PorQ family protein [Gemmatimonadales bacterium]|nr:PorV/PorQ family protein [Gemmatimonadales bacterium]